MARRNPLRPAGFDELGLRRALADRMLPFLVAAMAFLAALGMGGWVGAAALAQRWQAGPEASLTVQVPQPLEMAVGSSENRLDRAVSILNDAAEVAEARVVSKAEMAELLRPWLGDGKAFPAVPLPGVIAVRLSDPDASTAALATRLDAAVPGALVENHDVWLGRLARLARSLQACAGAALLVLTAVAAAVVAVATRAGLAARREAIEIVHGLGASDGYIAGRFAARTTGLAATGALVGAVAAAPALLWMAQLAAPFLEGGDPGWGAAVPPGFWMLLAALPLTAAAIGFVTAQATVRRWLRDLP